MVRKTPRKGRAEARAELKKWRLAMDISYRLRKLTPEELRELPYETVREALAFLGLDPDEPLPGEINLLIEEMQIEKRYGTGLCLVDNGGADAVQQVSRDRRPDGQTPNEGQEAGYSREAAEKEEISTAMRLVPGAHGGRDEDRRDIER
jgi:hypothetical protein